MAEGRGSAGGWSIVALAVVAIVAFAGLLYVRGASPSSVPLATLHPSGPTTAVGSAAPSAAPSGSAGRSAAPSGTANPGQSGSPAASGATRTPGASATGGVAGATFVPSPSPTRTPKPTRTPAATPRPTASPTAAVSSGYQLPANPQAATASLDNGQGGCPGFPAGGVIAETTFAITGPGSLTAKSPAGHTLTGRIQADGSFSLSGTGPTERWIGKLTQDGGSGSWFVVSNGCTQAYDTAITFHS